MSYGPPSGGYGPPPPGPPGGYGPPPGPGGPPPPGPGGPAYGTGGQPPGQQPDNWMWAAIVSLLCCTLFGVISLIFSLQVSSKWQIGDYHGAQDAANKAKIFGLIGVIGGAVWAVIVLIWFFLSGLAAVNDPYYY